MSLTIGGMAVTPQYAGLVAAGLYQINAAVPPLPAGDHEVIASIEGVSSPTGALLRVG